MQRPFFPFPSGAPGCGLLMLRIIVAVALHLGATGHLGQNPNVLVFAALILLSTLITLGLLTPVAATLGAGIQLVLTIASGANVSFATVIGPLSALALVLLGPGAHSIDAALFGRKVLILRGTNR